MSTAAPPRLATADNVAPRTELNAHGSVLVNGHGSADMPRMGPPRPRSETVPALSPARTALAQHIEHLATLAAEVERASRPVHWCKSQVNKAQGELVEAEAALAAIDNAHSARIVEAAKNGTFSEQPVESAEAEAAVSRARRNCNSVRQALAECEGDLQRANANLEAANANFAPLALAVLVAEHHAHLARWAKARDAYHLAEVQLLGLHSSIGEYGRTLESKAPGAGLGWLRQLEKLHPPWNIESGQQERGPREVAAAAGRWAVVLERLRADPNAAF